MKAKTAKALVREIWNLKPEWAIPLPFSAWGRPHYTSEIYKKLEESIVMSVRKPTIGPYTTRIRISRNLQPPTDQVWGITEGKPLIEIKIRGFVLKTTHQTVAVRFIEMAQQGHSFLKPGSLVVSPPLHFGNVSEPLPIWTLEHCCSIERYGTVWYSVKREPPFGTSVTLRVCNLRKAKPKDLTMWHQYTDSLKREVKLHQEALLESAVSNDWVYNRAIAIGSMFNPDSWSKLASDYINSEDNLQEYSSPALQALHSRFIDWLGHDLREYYNAIGMPK